MYAFVVAIIFLQCSKWVKKAKLPSISKRSSRSLEQKELQKMKESLQRFLSVGQYRYERERNRNVIMLS